MFNWAYRGMDYWINELLALKISKKGDYFYEVSLYTYQNVVSEVGHSSGMVTAGVI